MIGCTGMSNIIAMTSVLDSKDSRLLLRAANIGGGKGGAMGLQPHLNLRVLHWMFIFYHRNIFFSVS